MVTSAAFCPETIARLRNHTAAYVARARQAYSRALRANLRALLDGDIAPRRFVKQFFALTEAGNLRHDIRKRLVVSLLLSRTIRPGIKFLFLENLYRFPASVRDAIIAETLRTPDAPHLDMVKEELRWIMGVPLGGPVH
jgi:hypothetical protein